jgi:hypothetical protein
MPKLELDFIEEIQLFANFVLSAFSKKYKNEWLCLFTGLPLLFLYDHPYLILNILK